MLQIKVQYKFVATLSIGNVKYSAYNIDAILKEIIQYQLQQQHEP